MSDRTLHPDLNDAQVLALHHEAIELFNAGRFFESHEPWEEIWRSTNPQPRDLFQGLVQIAAGMYHWTVRGRSEPAARLLSRGIRRLAPLAPEAMGLDIEALLRGLEPWQRWLSKRSGPPPMLPTLKSRR